MLALFVITITTKCVQSMKFSLGGGGGDILEVLGICCWSGIWIQSVEHADMSNSALLDHGPERRAARRESQLLPNYIWVLWVLFSSPVHVWLTCVPIRARIIPTFHFQAVCSIFGIATLQMELDARGGGRHPGEQRSKTLLTMENEYTEILCSSS